MNPLLRDFGINHIGLTDPFLAMGDQSPVRRAEEQDRKHTCALVGMASIPCCLTRAHS